MSMEPKDFQRSIKEISDKQLKFWHDEVKKEIEKKPNDAQLQMKKIIIEFEEDRRRSLQNTEENK